MNKGITHPNIIFNWVATKIYTPKKADNIEITIKTNTFL